MLILSTSGYVKLRGKINAHEKRLFSVRKNILNFNLDIDDNYLDVEDGGNDNNYELLL